jgi:hypothetical protein
MIQKGRGFCQDNMAPGPYPPPSIPSECIKLGDLFFAKKRPYAVFNSQHRVISSYEVLHTSLCGSVVLIKLFTTFYMDPLLSFSSSSEIDDEYLTQSKRFLKKCGVYPLLPS